MMGTTLERGARHHLPLVSTPRAQVPCLSCGVCCTYVAVEISAPDSVRHATEILWYLYHQQVSVYRDNDDEWVVQLASRCRHLGHDNKCAIYEQRPIICREHSEETCEVNAEEAGTTYETPEAFLAYLKERSRRIHALVLKKYDPQAGARPGPAPRSQSRRRANQAGARP